MTVDEAQELRVLSRRITAALVVVAVVAMVFTAVSVTTFALDHGVSPWVAWTLDPMVAVALLAVLLADARLVELGVSPSGWATTLRWFAGLATWTMNAWQSVWPDGGFGVPRDVDAAGVVLHSVAPVLLVLLAEAATGYRRVIADRIRMVEGRPQHGHPHLGVVVDDHIRGAAEMVAIEDASSSWDEPWRAPWDDEPEGWASKTQVQVSGIQTPADHATGRSIDPLQPLGIGAPMEASRHREASPVGSFRDLADDHPDDRPDFLRSTSKTVGPVVAGWSSTPASDDHLDDQAHDHPGTFRDPGKMVGPVVAVGTFGDHRNDQDVTTSTTSGVVADAVTSVAGRATQADHRDDHLGNQGYTTAWTPGAEGWASVPTLDDQDDEVFRGSPANFRGDPDVAADHSGTWRSDGLSSAEATANRGRTTTVDEGYGVVRTPGDDLGVAEAMSDADLRKAARKLLRESVRTTGRPMTVDALRTELGVSRRRAVRLRREVLGTAS